MTNREYGKQEWFVERIERVFGYVKGLGRTRDNTRQASKFRRKKGLVYEQTGPEKGAA